MIILLSSTKTKQPIIIQWSFCSTASPTQQPQLESWSCLPKRGAMNHSTEQREVPAWAKRQHFSWFNGQMEEKIHFELTWIEIFSIFPVKQKVEKINGRLLFVFSRFLFSVPLLFQLLSGEVSELVSSLPTYRLVVGEKNNFCLKLFCRVVEICLGLREVRIVCAQRMGWGHLSWELTPHPWWDPICSCLWHCWQCCCSQGWSLQTINWQKIAKNLSILNIGALHEVVGFGNISQWG